ncbi:MFS transporter [Cohnella terricola]|uniref:MFS transporter n=1 Tax=Cohnella terricola TaxID=1289167 RepID=A0A559J573_9BACL|nr:MFS transporter [Cohnella terricola]TVX95012.1 MFS transporter [Cohnella terricola]
MGRLVFLGCIAYLVVGIGQLVVGTVMEPMVEAYGIKYGDGGQLVMNQFLGGLVGIMLAPWLMGLIGKKPLLLSALGVMAVAEIIYSLHPSWGVMLTAAPFAGFGFGTTEAVVGSFIIGSALGNANVAMSRVEVFFGVGALLMPFAGAALISSGHWISAFTVVGVLAALAMVMWLVYWPKILDRPKENVAHAAAELSKMPNRGRVLIVLAACSMFFAVYVGFEMSFVHYLPSLLVKNNGLSESTASLSLSLFWGAMALGRVVSGQAADRWGGGTYMLVTCISAAILFIIMGGLDSTWATFTLTFLAGLAMSGMFAIALVFANRAVPGMTERTTSLLMAFGGIGGALLPKLTGWFLDENGVGATWWLFAGYAVLMLGVIIWALLSAKLLERARSRSGSVGVSA